MSTESDLTPVEECLIAKCHPIGTIIKLRPGGRPSPVTYNTIWGHMIVIPQDPGPLLHELQNSVRQANSTQHQNQNQLIGVDPSCDIAALNPH
jgi:hypothetical protein